MGLEAYQVARDYFEPDENTHLAFPCCACRYQHGTDKEEPCIRCDWNLNAKPDDELLEVVTSNAEYRAARDPEFGRGYNAAKNGQRRDVQKESADWYAGYDARRIVACVNACADIPTASLEGMEVGHLNSIHRQRDELLQVVIGAIECNYFPDLADPCLKSKALAAITKATGSTQPAWQVDSVQA